MKTKKFLPTFFSLAFMCIFIASYSIIGCQKTQNPFGVYAPQGLDRPTLTPTPSSGVIQVYVDDSGTAIQGVSVIVVDPLGNTIGPNITQPIVGYAAFNPSNLLNGTWTAKVLTQGISYVAAGPLTIDHYYYSSSQPFTVSGAYASYGITFSTVGNSVSTAPTSFNFGLPYPVNIPMTVTYNQNGNLNVPVSITCPMLPTGISASPSSFILGEGVTQQPVTISKSTCYSKNIPFQITTLDFTANPILTNPVTIFHSYPVSIIMSGTNVSDSDPTCTSYCYTFYLNTTNDCGVVWNYSIDSTVGQGNLGTGTISSGGNVTWSDPIGNSDSVNFTIINSSVGTFAGFENLFSLSKSGPTTFQKIISNQ